MRLKDWEILKVGDTLIRRKYISTGYVSSGPRVSLSESVEFTIAAIQRGRVYATRLLSRREHPGMMLTDSEWAEIEVSAGTAPVPDVLAYGDVQYVWDWNAPARGEARLTGGFVVTRADGSVERDRCPTDTTAQ